MQRAVQGDTLLVPAGVVYAIEAVGTQIEICTEEGGPSFDDFE